MCYTYLGRYNRSLNSLRTRFGKLHCPNCCKNNIMVDTFDNCQCTDCYSVFEFSKLMTIQQIRDKKIDSIS